MVWVPTAPSHEVAAPYQRWVQPIVTDHRDEPPSRTTMTYHKQIIKIKRITKITVQTKTFDGIKPRATQWRSHTSDGCNPSSRTTVTNQNHKNTKARSRCVKFYALPPCLRAFVAYRTNSILNSQFSILNSQL